MKLWVYLGEINYQESFHVENPVILHWSVLLSCDQKNNNLSEWVSCVATQLLWNLVRLGARLRATAALRACVRGVERDPCLGEWVGCVGKHMQI